MSIKRGIIIIKLTKIKPFLVIEIIGNINKSKKLNNKNFSFKEKGRKY